MEESMQKIFKLLNSNDQANRVLAMQLLESQNLFEYHPLVFKHKGYLYQAQKLECLRLIEQRCSEKKLERRQFWRLFSICDECFSFVRKQHSWSNVNVEIFMFQTETELRFMIKLDALMWDTSYIGNKLKYLNDATPNDKKRFGKELLKPVWLRAGDILRNGLPAQELVTIAKLATHPIDYWTTAFDDGIHNRLHVKIRFEVKLKQT